MNTFWIKIASGAIGVLIIIVVASMFMGGGENNPVQEPAESNSPPITGFYGQANHDMENFSVPDDSSAEDQPEITVPQPNQPSATTVQPVPPQPQPTEITIYVKQLGEMDKIEAERELNYAVPSLSIARLPMTSYGPMLESARRIINRWPDSIYAYQARRMIAEVPERFRQQFHITSEEMDTSMFRTPRAGTVPVQVKIEDR